MDRPASVDESGTPYPVGPFPIGLGDLVGEDERGRLVPVDRAVRFVGVAKRAHPGSDEPGAEIRVEIARSGPHAFGFRGWTPTFADVGRTVWAFSQNEVAGAPLRTAFSVRRVVGVANTIDGGPGVRVDVGTG